MDIEPLHSSGSDSGYLSVRGQAPTPLRDSIAQGNLNDIHGALSALAQEARQSAYPAHASDRFCEALLTPCADGGSALHAASEARNPAVLDALMSTIEALAGEGLLEGPDVLQLLCAHNRWQQSALHQLASARGGPGIARFGDMLLTLHRDGRLTDEGLAAVLLQRSQGETPLQFALMRGGEAGISGMFGLLARALHRGALSADEVCDALTARRLLSPSDPRAVGAESPMPLALPFLSADLPHMRAVIAGVDALVATERMSPEALRRVMAPVLDSTGGGVRRDNPQMTRELRDAEALAADARQRWFRPRPETTREPAGA